MVETKSIEEVIVPGPGLKEDLRLLLCALGLSEPERAPWKSTISSMEKIHGQAFQQQRKNEENHFRDFP